MASKPLREIIDIGAGSRLAIELDFMETRAATTVNYEQQGLIDASAGLTTLLSLTGRWEIQWFGLSAILANDIDHLKLTIDGVVICSQDGLSSNATTWYPFGPVDGDNGFAHYMCDSSLLMEVEMSTDTAITFSWAVRAIL